MTEAKAKKELMKRALEIDPTVHVGKYGIDGNLNEEVTKQLKSRRLVKIKVNSNADSNTKDVAETIAEATGSVVVDVRGGIVLLTDKRTWDSLCQKKNFD